MVVGGDDVKGSHGTGMTGDECIELFEGDS